MTAYGPYSPVREIDNLLFVSGQIGIDATTKQAPDSIEEQTKLAIHNMEQALIDVGASLPDVVKTTVFLTNMDDFTAMNKVYETLFKAPRQARSTICVKELHRVGGTAALIVEIEAIAYRKSL
jgi:2-iminobutanoate/2-iminopropanoate deaminase